MLVMPGVHDAVDRHRRRIDAVRRHQLVVGLQVRRRESELAAALPPLDDRAVDEVRMAEQRARFVHAALGDQPPDARAADDEVLVAHRIDLVGAEPVALAERAQQR